MEIWKDIPGYEGRYQVSDLGNVRSLNYRNTGKIQIIKSRLTDKGYLQIGLALNGKMKTFSVHVLVAMAFLGHIPDGHNLLVDHREERNKLDNRLENLQITTSRFNRTKAIVKNLPIGVDFLKRNKKYRARIRINGKTIHLGNFSTPEEASAAYQKALNNLSPPEPGLPESK